MTGKFLLALALLLTPVAAVGQEQTPATGAAEHFEAAFANVCFGSDASSAEYFPHEAWELSWRPDYADTDATATLHRFFCGAGAYNTQFVFYIERDFSGPMPVAFATPVLEIAYENDDFEAVESIEIVGYRAEYLLTNARFDLENRTIGTMVYWRGLGDASSSGTWVFDDGEFVLKTYDVDASYDGEIDPERIVDYR